MGEDDESAGLAYQQQLEEQEYLDLVFEQLLEQVNAELKLWGKENEN